MNNPKSTRPKIMKINLGKPSNHPGDDRRIGFFARCLPAGQGGFVFSGCFHDAPVTSRNVSVISVDAWIDSSFLGRVAGSSRVFLMHDL